MKKITHPHLFILKDTDFWLRSIHTFLLRIGMRYFFLSVFTFLSFFSLSQVSFGETPSLYNEFNAVYTAQQKAMPEESGVVKFRFLGDTPSGIVTARTQHKYTQSHPQEGFHLFVTEQSIEDGQMKTSSGEVRIFGSEVYSKNALDGKWRKEILSENPFEKALDAQKMPLQKETFPLLEKFLQGVVGDSEAYTAILEKISATENGLFLYQKRETDTEYWYIVSLNEALFIEEFSSYFGEKAKAEGMTATEVQDLQGRVSMALTDAFSQVTLRGSIVVEKSTGQLTREKIRFSATSSGGNFLFSGNAFYTPASYTAPQKPLITE